eukprot:COSAG01_NODE_5037_length_4532_cov_1.928265_5_plen_63_part_00
MYDIVCMHVPLLSQALDKLDEYMEELFEYLPDEDTFKGVLSGIFVAFVQVLTCVRCRVGNPS